MRSTRLKRQEVVDLLELGTGGDGQKAVEDGNSTGLLASQLPVAADWSRVSLSKQVTAYVSGLSNEPAALLCIDPLFYAPYFGDVSPFSFIECRQDMHGVSVGEWFGKSASAVSVERHAANLVAHMGATKAFLADRMLSHVCSAISPDGVPARVASLAYAELEADVAEREMFAVAFAAALAEVAGRLGLGAITLWANGLMLRFVPDPIRQFHLEAGDERAGAELIGSLQRALGSLVAGYRYQLIWRLKHPTSVLSNLLRMLAGGGESRSGMQRDLAASIAEKLLSPTGARGLSAAQYEELIFDHFACTAILYDLTEPADYESIAAQIALGEDWTSIKVEFVPRQAYHRRLFAIANHTTSHRRLELLVKSHDAFLIGRAYQWTSRGSALAASAGPFVNGNFDWSVAASRIAKAGSIVRALSAECTAYVASAEYAE